MRKRKRRERHREKVVWEKAAVPDQKPKLSKGKVQVQKEANKAKLVARMKRSRTIS